MDQLLQFTSNTNMASISDKFCDPIGHPEPNLRRLNVNNQ
jgi:hypothetical protein